MSDSPRSQTPAGIQPLCRGTLILEVLAKLCQALQSICSLHISRPACKHARIISGKPDCTDAGYPQLNPCV